MRWHTNEGSTARTRRRRLALGTALAAVAVLVIGVLAVVNGQPSAPQHPATELGPASSGGSTDKSFLTVITRTSDPVTLQHGYSIVDSTPAELSAVKPPQKSLVWLGEYDDASCTWEYGDDQIKSLFEEHRLAEAPQVAGYYIADEPNSDRNCPQAPAMLRSRNELVRTLDPDMSRFTFSIFDDPDQFAAFRGSVDVMGIDPYPCRTDRPCDWSLIPSHIEKLREAGVDRYVGVLQAFSSPDEEYRWPTAQELEHMIAQWQRSDWQGQATFAWDYAGAVLSDRPDLLEVLRRLNNDPTAPFPLPPA